MRALAFLPLSFSLLASTAPAYAEAPAFEDWRALGDGVVALSATGSDAQGKLTLRRLDAKLAPADSPVTVYEGAPVVTALAAREGSAAVLLGRGGAQPWVKVAIVDLASRSVRSVALARTAGAEYVPSAAVATADADGFTLLWQEQKRGDPRAEALSTMARVKPDGTVVMTPTAVPVPWSLAAIIDDGRGYTLAVNYDGTAPDQTRLCFVTLSRQGQPEQHPWWGSRPDVVTDVQLVLAGGKVNAVYRGGAHAGSLLAVVADKDTGRWGLEAPPSRPLVTGLAPAAPFAVRAKDGVVSVVKR